MAIPLLDLHAQYRGIADELGAAVQRVIDSQRFILGPEVEQFEARVREYTGARHAIGCASGTDAILLALKALQLPPGSDVVVPSFTFFATAGAVWNAGLRPVFADVNARTFNLDAETLRAALTPNTRAVIVVHLFGQMAPMPELLEVCAERGIPLIEDAAQAIGARQSIGGRAQHAGTVGLAGTLSFFPSKNLGGFGDGGMVLTNDDEFAALVMKLRVHGGRQMYHHEIVGLNSRLDSLQAAILAAKLPHLDRWAAGRKRNADFYDARLSPLRPRLCTPYRDECNEHVFNQYTLLTERRDDLKRWLEAREIGTAIYYPLPLHLQECFRELGYQRGDLPTCERLAQEALSLPIFPELTEEQLETVAAAVESFVHSNQT